MEGKKKILLLFTFIFKLKFQRFPEAASKQGMQNLKAMGVRGILF